MTSREQLPYYNHPKKSSYPFETEAYIDLLRKHAAKYSGTIAPPGQEDLAQVVGVTVGDNRHITLGDLISSWRPQIAPVYNLQLRHEPTPVRSIFELSTAEVKKAAAANIEPSDSVETLDVFDEKYKLTGINLLLNISQSTPFGLYYLSYYRFQVGLLEDALTLGKFDPPFDFQENQQPLAIQ